MSTMNTLTAAQQMIDEVVGLLPTFHIEADVDSDVASAAGYGDWFINVELEDGRALCSQLHAERGELQFHVDVRDADAFDIDDNAGEAWYSTVTSGVILAAIVAGVQAANLGIRIA